MCTSGCGFMTATFFRRSKRSFESFTYSRFQNTSPSLLMAITTFSGLVCVGTLRSFGSASGTCCTTTGIVMRKMMSSTSITSTSGVVLMAAITSCSPSETSWPTVIAMGYPSCPPRRLSRGRDGRGGGTRLRAAADEDHVQVRAERAQLLERDLVAAHQPVVAQHRRHRDREAEGRHDERLAHRARDLVDRGLARDADGGQGVVDAPHRAEEAHERGRGAHGREERGAVLQARGALGHAARGEERLGGARLAEELRLLVDLHEHDVPAPHRHDH